MSHPAPPGPADTCPLPASAGASRAVTAWSLQPGFPLISVHRRALCDSSRLVWFNCRVPFRGLDGSRCVGPLLLKDARAGSYGPGCEEGPCTALSGRGFLLSFSLRDTPRLRVRGAPTHNSRSLLVPRLPFQPGGASPTRRVRRSVESLPSTAATAGAAWVRGQSVPLNLTFRGGALCSLRDHGGGDDTLSCRVCIPSLPPPARRRPPATGHTRSAARA